MRWSDEKYVKLYTRDTADWLCLSWRAQGLFCLLMRKCDGAGLVFLGRHGKKAVATLIGTGWCAEIEAALDELLEDGCVTFESPYLLIRNFTEAQEARASDKTRKQHEREMAKARAVAAARSENANQPESFNTDVTRGHTESRGVTSCPTQTSSAQLSAEREGAREAKPEALDAFVTALRGHYARNHCVTGDIARGNAETCAAMAAEVARFPSPETAAEVVAAEVKRRLDAKVWSRVCCRLDQLVTVIREIPAPKAKRAPGQNPAIGDPDYDRPDAWWSLAAFNARPRRNAA